MGCGCKNKQQAPITAAEATKIQQQAIQTKQQQNESIKQTIKKTVEKYYNVDKKTN
jgi:hypothetical protein